MMNRGRRFDVPFFEINEVIRYIVVVLGVRGKWGVDDG